jgi:hypothetical protein
MLVFDRDDDWLGPGLRIALWCIELQLHRRIQIQHLAHTMFTSLIFDLNWIETLSEMIGSKNRHVV